MVMNSVVKRIIYCKLGLFAYDKYIYRHCLTYQLPEAVLQANSDAQAVADWTREHGLLINLSKTTAIKLGSNSKLRQLQAL